MTMPSLLLPDPLLSLLPAFPLLTVFILLSLGIWLIPFAEEIALMTAGYLYYSGQSPFLLVLGVTGTGLFLGDFLAFQVGRSCRCWQGAEAALVSGSRQWGGLLASFVARYGVGAVFWARFLPGVRLATYILAGLTGMPVGLYVRVTVLAVGVYVPLMLLLAASWGAEIDAALQAVHQVGFVTWGLVSIGISLAVMLQWWRARGPSFFTGALPSERRPCSLLPLLPTGKPPSLLTKVPEEVQQGQFMPKELMGHPPL